MFCLYTKYAWPNSEVLLQDEFPEPQLAVDKSRDDRLGAVYVSFRHEECG